MKSLRSIVAGAFLAGVVATGAVRAAEDARPRDVQRLQEDLANLDEELRDLDPRNPKADDFRRRAESIREETIYLKVKMQRHQHSELGGTGIGEDEVTELRRSITDLREDVERAAGRGDGEVRLREGTDILIRLEEPVSSKTARTEDRFWGTVFRPVRAEGRMAFPAGTRVRGTVRSAEPAQRPSKAGRLELDVDYAYVGPNRVDLRGRVVAVSGEEEGGMNTGGKVGLGAALGGIVGGIIGGGKGAALGVVLGAGGAVAGTKGDEVELPAGAILTFRLDRHVVVPRAPAPDRQ